VSRAQTAAQRNRGLRALAWRANRHRTASRYRAATLDRCSSDSCRSLVSSRRLAIAPERRTKQCGRVFALCFAISSTGYRSHERRQRRVKHSSNAIPPASFAHDNARDRQMSCERYSVVTIPIAQNDVNAVAGRLRWRRMRFVVVGVIVVQRKVARHRIGQHSDKKHDHMHKRCLRTKKKKKKKKKKRST
jgi:hypothetical protein